MCNALVHLLFTLKIQLKILNLDIFASINRENVSKNAEISQKDTTKNPTKILFLQATIT